MLVLGQIFVGWRAMLMGLWGLLKCFSVFKAKDFSGVETAGDKSSRRQSSPELTQPAGWTGNSGFTPDPPILFEHVRLRPEMSRPRSASRKTVAERNSPTSLGDRSRAEKKTKIDRGRSQSQCPEKPRMSRRPAPIIDYGLKIEPLEFLKPVTTRSATSPPPSLSVPSSKSSWRAKEMIMQENAELNLALEKSRSRLEQLERTIRWWADCTNSWREKWQSAKEERNDLRVQNRNLLQQLSLNGETPLEAGRSNRSPKTKRSRRIKSPDFVDSACQTSNENEDSTPEPTAEFDLHSLLRDLANVTIREITRNAAVQTDHSGYGNDVPPEEYREELRRLRLQNEELVRVDQENTLQLSLLRAECHVEADTLRLELQSEINAKDQLEMKLSEFRYKVEDWQQQVSSAHLGRASAEAEKASLIRDLRKARNHCEVLQLQIDKLNQDRRKSAMTRTKDLTPGNNDQETQDLRKENTRLQKSLQDQMTELGHSIRRVEHYEADVELLHAKIAMLNHELGAVQNASNNHVCIAERLKLLNQDLQEQVDSMQTQLAHLQTRSVNPGKRLVFHDWRRGGPGSEDDINIDL